MSIDLAPPLRGAVPAGTTPWYSPRPASSTRANTQAALTIFAFWLAAALVWPLTDSVVPWDSKNHFYPMLRHLGGALAAGEVPLWNPYHFGGHPAVADPQSLLFTPTMLLFGWLVPAPSMQLFDLVVFAHLLPGALAFVPIFRRRGWAPAGAVLAGLIFILGGSASARLQHTGIIFGYGLFPLAFWLLEEALSRRSYAVSAVFAVVASVMVVGRDQVAFLSGLALLGVLAHHAAASGHPLAFLRRRLGLLALMGATGAALLALPVLLTMQLLSTSTRPAFGYGVAAMGSLPPESLATVLFADIFGSLRTTYDYWGPDWHSLLEGTWTDRATNYLFIGTAPGLLILWHGIAGGRLFAREFRYFLVLGAASLVYALGRYTPAFSLIFDNLPGVSLYRRPADATFLINIGLAFSAGYLLHRYREDGLPDFRAWRVSPLTALRIAAAAGLVLAAVAAGLEFASRDGKVGLSLREVALGLVIAGAAALALTRFGLATKRRALAAALLVAATGAELIWRNAASALNAEPASGYAVFSQLPPAQQAGLNVLRTELASRHARGERPRVEVLGLGGAWQNASMVLHLENTLGYNPLRLADYERAIGPGENAADPNLRRFPGTFRGYRSRLAGLLGLEYLVLDRPAERLPKHFPRLGDARLLYASAGMWIYRLSPASPRAYLATRLVPVDSAKVLEAEELPEFDRAQAALIERAQVDGLRADYGLRDDSPEPTPAAGSVRIVEHRRNAVSLEVETDRNSVVVLHDLDYPGWVATVDGKPVEILRTNLLFRGVEVGPGRHRIEFRFEPFAKANLIAAARGLLRKDYRGAGDSERD